MKANYLLSILCSFVLLSGCVQPASTDPAPQDQLTLGKVQGEIKIGMSAASVVEILGSPNIVTTDEERREVWVYDKVSTERVEASTSSYGTLIIFGGSAQRGTSSTRQRTLTIIIKYDAEKKVRDFAYNYTQF
jgi:outer membrane protein assembly factor BamE (lipoprotein component of BamABCDE complex)